MAKQPNYRQERISRERNRNLKQQEKLKRREEDAAKRKALRAEDDNNEPKPS
jgi:hypothetical protein